MTTYALRLESGTDTAARVRMADLLALPAGAAPLTSRSALRADGGGAVTVINGTMTVSVAPFIAWVQGGVSVTQGGYPFVHDAALTLAIDPGHASLARVDVIAGVVRDNAFDASGQVLAGVQVVKGTPGSGTPALPTNSVALREINIPAGTSAGGGGLTASNLGTDRRAYLSDQTPWAVPLVANGLVNYGAGYETIGYSRKGTDVTHRGVAVHPVALSAGTVFTNVPAGFRPLATHPDITFAGGNPVQIEARANGDIAITAAVPANTPVLLNIRWSTT